MPRPAGGMLRVVLADDDPLVRDLVGDTLSRDGVSVVGNAGNGREAVELVLEHRPDVVLMDVTMPELDGIAATRRIREHAPEASVVMMSRSDDTDLALLGLRAGASGFVSKDAGVAGLSGVLERAAAGEPVLSPRVASGLIDELRRGDVAGMRPIRSHLSSREWEVADMLVAGRSEEQIAGELVLSIETIRSHVKSLHRKLDVHTRAELLEAVRSLRSG